MIQLQSMSEQEYPAYRRLFIEEYARDLSENHDYSLEQARDNAKSSIQEYLPQAVQTPGQRLYTIKLADDGQMPVGYLWVALKGGAAFINDLCILEPWRRRGYGKAALDALDELLCDWGVSELGLRVAANNPGAKALYDQCGFRATGINMAKKVRP